MMMPRLALASVALPLLLLLLLLPSRARWLRRRVSAHSCQWIGCHGHAQGRHGQRRTGIALAGARLCDGGIGDGLWRLSLRLSLWQRERRGGDAFPLSHPLRRGTV